MRDVVRKGVRARHHIALRLCVQVLKRYSECVPCPLPCLPFILSCELVSSFSDLDMAIRKLPLGARCDKKLMPKVRVLL